MANPTLLIIKNQGADSNFSHEFSIGLNYMNSDFEFGIANGQFQIKELNGSQIYPILWSDVTLRDDSSGVMGTPYTASWEKRAPVLIHALADRRTISPPVQAPMPVSGSGVRFGVTTVPGIPCTLVKTCPARRPLSTTGPQTG